MRNTSIKECKIVELKQIGSRKGLISVIHNYIEIPFTIKRIYYLYDIPAGENRGGHAHKELEQLIIAVSGSFDVIIDDGLEKKRITLNRPNIGLCFPPGIWREIDNFSAGAVCLVMASHKYEESDYIRSFNDFLIYKQ